MVLLAQLHLVENIVDIPYAFEKFQVDLCHFSTLGGVYHLDILELPPQYKPVKGWVLVEVGRHTPLYKLQVTLSFFTSHGLGISCTLVPLLEKFLPVNLIVNVQY